MAGTVLHSSHWGAFRVGVENGRLTDIQPFERDADPSALLAGMKDYFDHPTRIRRPAVRRGWLENGPDSDTAKRGADPFVEVSWDEALDLAAAELARVKREHGNRAIFGGSYGWSSAGRFHHAKTQVKRFLNAFGGCVEQVNNYSFGAAMVLLPHIVGDNRFLYGPTTHWRAIAKNTEILLAFGGLPGRNTQIESGGCGEHVQKRWLRELAGRARRIVNVSPLRDDIEETACEWWPICPGADTALLLALAHTLLTEGLADRAFLERCTTGHERFADYVLSGRGAAGFDAEWAAGICELAAPDIRELARQLVAHRSFITLNWSLQRSDYGEQPYFAAVALAAMIGQIGLPGGGIGFGYGSMNGIGNAVPRFRTPLLPTGTNAVDLAIPVARVSDLLLRPGETIAYNGRELTFPEIQLVYWAGGNPYHHHQDLNRLQRAWQAPRSIIVHETHWTATARRADIVLPATTTLERNDIGTSSSDRFMIAMKQAVPPFAEARDDYSIFRALAERLGVAEAFTEGHDEMAWLRRLYEDARTSSNAGGLALPDFEHFWEQGLIELPATEAPFNLLADFRADPEGRPLATPSGRIEIFSATIDGFGYADCPGHPVWRPAREWRGAAAAQRYPLHLITNQPRTRLHGQMDVVGISQTSKIDGREPIRVHPADAARRNLKDGAIVRVFNDRGACLAGVVVSQDLRPGVVQMATGAWFDPVHPGVPGSLDAHGNPNVLTHDIGTSSLSQGPSALSCLVEIEAFNAPLPELSIGAPPPFIERPFREPAPTAPGLRNNLQRRKDR
ncbi:molybdopterin-dependent oxidoreductase [Ancylobacter pratisalsi]|uniref:Molybdopterin-dependent oxidoreductase n=1 Tax=Ancylobacter pratisalsi TaxID=1745854 RepID=A0A6P1YNG8_9HYPH|nr:molybdopterin-dependent oxidoreductase [Ancylobacter pratisalsi]QIB34602.1 molybdopterin-dependent oxidoreductase [Ancylobacter pratisalsi]